jgi:hypothetical protein
MSNNLIACYLGIKLDFTPEWSGSLVDLLYLDPNNCPAEHLLVTIDEPNIWQNQADDFGKWLCNTTSRVCLRTKLYFSDVKSFTKLMSANSPAITHCSVDWISEDKLYLDESLVSVWASMLPGLDYLVDLAISSNGILSNSSVVEVASRIAQNHSIRSFTLKTGGTEPAELFIENLDGNTSLSNLYWRTQLDCVTKFNQPPSHVKRILGKI